MRISSTLMENCMKIQNIAKKLLFYILLYLSLEDLYILLLEYLLQTKNLEEFR